jgi:hypothetical protein
LWTLVDETPQASSFIAPSVKASFVKYALAQCSVSGFQSDNVGGNPDAANQLSFKKRPAGGSGSPLG